MHATAGKNSTGATDHEVAITNREKVLIRGVLHVESFDDKEVVLETPLGTLMLKGENLHIRQLDLDEGNFAVEGLVTGLQYSAAGRDARDKGKGLLDRLLR